MSAVKQRVAPAAPAAAGAVPGPERPRHRRLGATSVALAGGWLAFLVLHRLFSGRWWRWLLPELIPPLAFVAVPLVLLVLGLMAGPARRRVALLAAAGLLLGADLGGLNPAALRTPPPVSPDALRVVSWNTTVWNHDDDPDTFYASLTSRRADVYLLQEYKPADDPAERDADLARLRREFPGYQIAARGELVTLSRYPIVGVLALPTDPPPGSDWQTEYREVKTLRTDLRVGSRTVSVYNAHILVPLDLSNPLRELFHERRREYFDRRETQYRGLIADLDRNPLPTLLAGDLNTSPSMGDLAALTARLTDAGRAADTFYPTSWSIAGQRWWRLDWSFVSPEWTVHGYRLRDSAGMSDHQVQELTLSLGGAR